ncbi:MAG: leucine-rich repeat domain-containing protein [Bacteroidales bacterium]|nr:leucine-rich repeat domain-containing protein [Bacteroidales bacterium]
MNKSLLYFILPFAFYFLCTGYLGAQKQPQSLSAEDLARYKEDAGQMVSFLQFTFNTLGNPEVSTKEKDIIINQSWTKIFENEKVQVEDDLDENREVPLNKDVQAYLKDIDFFFKEVAFTFTIQEIEQQVNEKNQLFFKVIINRNLKGTTIEGNKVDSNRLRYIEINLTDENKDLKVASIYTTKLNEREELRRWWNDLPTAWRNLLGENVMLKDTLRMKHVLWFNDSVAAFDVIIQRRVNQGAFSLNELDTLKIALSDTGNISALLIDRQIQKIIQVDTINFSGRKRIVSLEPLSKLPRIKYLDLSGTSVFDLMPARNLSHLEFLNCSNTLIDELEPIRYLTKLQELNAGNTKVADISTLANFTQLIRLNLSHTQIKTLDPLTGLVNIKDLDISGTSLNTLGAVSSLKSLDRLDFSATNITDVNPLKNLTELVFLKFENTPVSTLEPLSSLTNLRLLFIDQTPVSDLSPLSGLPNLSTIYCDQARVTRNEAMRFNEINPQVLVIYETSELKHWWNDLLPEWKSVFADKVALFANPTKEELHDVTRMRTLNIAENKALLSLDPVANMPMLNAIYCQGTGITNITPVSNLSDLRELNFSNTKVSDLSPLEDLTKLTKISFDHTNVTSFLPIMELGSLKVIYCDDAPVDETEIIEFLIRHPGCLVVYQTDDLRKWWDELPEVWKSLAEKYITPNTELSREQLQELANLRVVNLDESALSERSLEITSLEYLNKMILLEEVRFSNTRISSLAPLSTLNRLHTLICPNNPIESLQPLSELVTLEVLDIQNTAVSELLFLAPLAKLRKLNISGTQIKSLKGVEYLTGLEQLDCFNTRIKNLKQVQALPNLKLVKCYNTKITSRTIDKFRAARPEVEVVYY